MIQILAPYEKTPDAGTDIKKPPSITLFPFFTQKVSIFIASLVLHSLDVAESRGGMGIF
jgi:hypothetical protein